MVRVRAQCVSKGRVQYVSRVRAHYVSRVRVVQCVSRIKAQCVFVIKAQSRAGGRHEPSWLQELTAVLPHPQAILQLRLWSEV